MSSRENETLLQNVESNLIPIPSTPPFIVRGEGLTVEDIDGRSYLDFVAGPGVLSLGHCHSEVTAATQQQIGQLTQCPGNLLNLQSVQMARKLEEITPGDLKMSFFCNSGAEAVDAAAKLAIKHAGGNGKTAVTMVALEHSFHGRLSLPLSLTGMTGRKKGLGGYAAFPARHIMAPYCYRCALNYPACDLYCADELERLFLTQVPADSVAAFICEPVMGVAGVIVPPADYLGRIKEICSKNDVLVIMDEIFAGFGRTGKMFASQHFGIVPDIMTMAKALGGGLPLGGVIATESVGKSFEAGDHYTTYGWNNVVGITAGLKTIEVMQRDAVVANAAEVGDYFLGKLTDIQKQYSCIGDVRGCGLFIGVEIVIERKTKAPGKELANKIKDRMKDAGILVGVTGNFGCTVRITPPLNITKEHVDIFMKHFITTLSSL